MLAQQANKAHEFIRGVFIRGVFYSWGIITKTRKTQQNPRIYSWGIYSWGIYSWGILFGGIFIQLI